MSSARSDDTKSLKGVVLDWITPRDKPLNPPLSRSVKTTRGFNHPVGTIRSDFLPAHTYFRISLICYIELVQSSPAANWVFEEINGH